MEQELASRKIKEYDLRRRVLLLELARRKKANEHYSHRAYARDLGVSHSLFSLILNGKRRVSNELVKTLLSISQLPSETLEPLKIGLEQLQQQPSTKIELDKFALISDWIHYAILSLLKVEGFQWNVTWVSQRLNVSEQKAGRAMQRLTELGLVSCLEDGSYRQTTGPIVVENKDSSRAAKKFHSGLLKKALAAMNKGSFSERDLSSTVFTLSPEFIPYAVERIRNFRRSLTRELEGLGAQSEVYAITVELFPLTKKEGQDV